MIRSNSLKLEKIDQKGISMLTLLKVTRFLFSRGKRLMSLILMPRG
ncbi:MAG: hypothetical protein KAS65_13490 [Candidatus Aminicenantes bacterium]|nr:hypothetical protein [Candidatus Aminicenantes bacterium]